MVLLGAHAELQILLDAGGVVLATDWAATFLERLPVPGLTFHGRIGLSDMVDAAIVDGELCRYLGCASLRIRFDMSGWVPVKSVPAGSHILLRGDFRVRKGWFRCSWMRDVPLAFSFPVGRGQVFFTSFHNRAQMSDLEQTLLSLLAIHPVAAQAGRTMSQFITERNLGDRLTRRAPP